MGIQMSRMPLSKPSINSIVSVLIGAVLVMVTGYLANSLFLDSREIADLEANQFARETRLPERSIRLVSHSSVVESLQSSDAVKDDVFSKKIQPFLKTYCLECHSGKDAEADIDLARFNRQSDVETDLETWSHVLDQVEQGNMPPDDSVQPNERDRDHLKEWILKSISSAKTSDIPLGKLRRLNRVEYENTIRELFRLSRNCFNNPARLVQTTDYFQPATGRMPRYVLAVSYFFNSHRRFSDLPGVSTLPVDPPVEHGFANDQEALSLSPLLMENYLEISEALLNSSEFPEICGIWESMFVAGESASEEEMIRQAKEQISAFLPRAFRRNVSADELERYQKLFNEELKQTKSYTESMKTTASAIIVSPSFLYRKEFLSAPNEDGSAIDQNFAIANRLSYFLWGSMPDDALFQAARENRLNNAAGLERQVDRMMDDRRIKSLATDFGMQWLKVQKAASAFPNFTLFADYHAGRGKLPPPAVSMMIEQLLLFEAIMVENRSILEFVSSDFSYLNRQLMDWYQIDPKTALGYSPPLEDFEDFFRVKLPNRNRGGVITSGAMLVSTSTTKRTSPVYRGAWILDVIFNAPPPAPPANVPPLEQADKHLAVKLSPREKLAQHRLDPACASCHDRMDPLGFALEAFDAVGRWRQKDESGDPIDSSGAVNGQVYDGPASFKNAILRTKIRFVRAFVEHTMKYALGRQLHYSDEPEIRRITHEVMAQNYRFRAVIKEVVLSEMFRRFDD